MARLRGHNRRERYRGTALAEAAIVLMLLMLVTLGALQYGWAFYCLQRATNAARHGARAQAVVNPPSQAETSAQMVAMISDLEPTIQWPAAEEGMVTARVVVSQAKAQLIQWNLLPVPELRPTVTMRREGP